MPSTAFAAEALAIAERLVLLREGAVEATGRPMGLLARPGVAREAAGGIENLLPGTLAAHDEARGVTEVALDGWLTMAIPLASDQALGSRTTLAVRAEDLLVATEAVRGISARNVYGARVAAVERTGPEATLRCTLDGTRPERTWVVRVTPAAVEALDLRPGRAVWLARQEPLRAAGLSGSPSRRRGWRTFHDGSPRLGLTALGLSGSSTGGSCSERRPTGGSLGVARFSEAPRSRPDDQRPTGGSRRLMARPMPLPC